MDRGRYDDESFKLCKAISSLFRKFLRIKNLVDVYLTLVMEDSEEVDVHDVETLHLNWDKITMKSKETSNPIVFLREDPSGMVLEALAEIGGICGYFTILSTRVKNRKCRI